MELIDENEQRKIFQEKKDTNKIYTVLDMGEFIGHYGRSVFDKVYENWHLMFMDEYDGEKKIASVEALVDHTGDYSRFIVKYQGREIIVLVNNGKIYHQIGNELPDVIRDSLIKEFKTKDRELREMIENQKAK